jgi:hypothetical protein
VFTEEVGEESVGLWRGIDIEVVESVREQLVGSRDGVEVSEIGLEAHEVAGERLGCWFMLEGLLERGEGVIRAEPVKPVETSGYLRGLW